MKKKKILNTFTGVCTFGTKEKKVYQYIYTHLKAKNK